jgi:apolipoprotein N-acyltransferase
VVFSHLSGVDALNNATTRLNVQKRFSLPLHVLCGAGLALALPPLSLIWMGVVALSVLAVLHQQAVTRRHAFLRGLAFGFGYFVVALHWIGYAFFVDAAETLWMMPFAVGGLALFLSLYWAFGFVVVHGLEQRGFQRWLMLPVVLGVMEVLRGLLLTGFPWAAPGLIADGLGPALQLASFIGQWGLTVLILLWFSLPGVIVMKRKDRRFILPLALLMTLPGAWWWGSARLATPSGAGSAQHLAE